MKTDSNDTVKRVGDALLKHVRSVIRETAKGDPNMEFKLNRWVFARLQLDSRRLSRRVKQALWDSGMRSCQRCGRKFATLKGIEAHRKDKSLGYSVANCELVCRHCHQKLRSAVG